MELARIASLALVMFFSSFSFAQSKADDQTFDFDLLLTGGFTYGGDKMIDSYYTDGTHATIKGGSMYYFGMGLDFPITDNIHILTNGAYQLDCENGDNNTGAAFGRWAWEISPYYQASSWKFGAGAIYHTAPKIRFDPSDGVSFDARFDPALGATAFVGYQIPNSQSWVELRYSYIEYKVTSIGGIDIANGEKYDGSHVGLLFHWAIL